jgi:exopolysaccharide biosynthesis polyprenyl glycosylphosphotransferase
VPTRLAAPRLPGEGEAPAGRPSRGARAGKLLAAGLPLADLLALAVAALVSGSRLLPAAGYAACVLVILAVTGQHRLKITPRVSDQLGPIVIAAAASVAALLAWVPAGDGVKLAAISAVLIACARGAGYGALRAARRRGRLTEPALVVGTGETGTEVAGLLAGHPELGLRPAGYLDSQLPSAGPPLPVLGRPADLAGVVRQYGIRRVIVAFPAARDTDLVPALRAARQLPADVCVVPRLHEVGARLSRSSLDEIWGIPLVPLRRASLAGRVAKRGFDITFALALLMLAGPLMIGLGLVTRMQLRRPALFRQTRVTGPGRLAEIVKLRTMVSYGDPDTTWVVGSQRVTRFGRFLRATHADELPQLVNILRGEMSLVGPRPERPYFARRFEQEIPRYGDRHRVTGGLTGWAQVHGLHGDTSIRDRARFDNDYVENWSFWLDVVILVRTAASAVAGLLPGRSDRSARLGLSAASPTDPPSPESNTGGNS